MCEKARTQPIVLLQDPQKCISLRPAVIGLRPYFFILYHFFEAFRAILAYTSKCKGAWGRYIFGSLDSAPVLFPRLGISCLVDMVQHLPESGNTDSDLIARRHANREYYWFH